MYEVLFFICLPIVAFLYAAVGHGGASGYLALMSLFLFPAPDVKTIALTLNIFVAGIAFIQYYRAGYFNKKLFASLACTSVPFAFLGGFIQLNSSLYFYILGAFLFFAGTKLLFSTKAIHEKPIQKFNLPLALVTGAIIGFVSGLLGIGGGIILSPILLIMCWSNPKTTAGISALFIFVNSASALLGHSFEVGFVYPNSMLLITPLVIVGGLLGSFLGAQRLSSLKVRQVLAIVLLIAALKIFIS